MAVGDPGKVRYPIYLTSEKPGLHMQPRGAGVRFKSHCLRKPGSAKRWGSADSKDILVMQSLSHINTNGRGLRNFKSFLSENDHPP